MINVKKIAVLMFSKVLIRCLRLLNLGGTTLPGKVALYLYPQILKELSSQCKTIMVTGTNGKTTTTRMIENILKQNQLSFFTNKSGANLISGVATAFISASNLRGQAMPDIALIEIDEAAFGKVTTMVQPMILVITNFFRDQLDRYGELYTTLHTVLQGIQNSPDTTLVLNGDDSLSTYLEKKTSHPHLFFSISSSAYQSKENEVNNDARFCLFCKEKYAYSYQTYGHLGGFYCPSCGYQQPSADIACTSIPALSAQSSQIQFSTLYEGKLTKFETKLNLPGLYNIYNALAATACASCLNIAPTIVANALSSFERGFGRMESIAVGDKHIQVILVKNPTGFNQVLQFLQTISYSFTVALIINDQSADGTDISWLWDVDFETLNCIDSKIIRYYSSGIRAEDMAVRLKYAGVDTTKLTLTHDYKTLLEEALYSTPSGSTLFILPTYTAMLQIRKILRKKFGVKEFWK